MHNINLFIRLDSPSTSYMYRRVRVYKCLATKTAFAVTLSLNGTVTVTDEHEVLMLPPTLLLLLLLLPEWLELTALELEGAFVAARTSEERLC